MTSVACSSARRGAFEILSTTDPAEFSLSRDALRANESVRARMTRELFKFAYWLVLFVVFVCRSLAREASDVMKRGVLQLIRQIKILLGTHAPPPHDRRQTGDGRTSTKLRRHTTHDTRAMPVRESTEEGVPTQDVPPTLYAFRAMPDGPRGYKVGITKKGHLGSKRKLDEYAEQVR